MPFRSVHDRHQTVPRYVTTLTWHGEDGTIVCTYPPTCNTLVHCSSAKTSCFFSGQTRGLTTEVSGAACPRPRERFVRRLARHSTIWKSRIRNSTLVLGLNAP